METPDASAESIFDEAGAIIVDTTCRRCGYNLRGLREDGRCPECGTAIGLSTRGDLLRFAEPEWVDKLARGVRYILWGIVLQIVIGGLVGCATGFYGQSAAVAGVVALIAGLLRIYGGWLLTSPDPSRIGEDRHITTRKTVRAGLIAGVFGDVTDVAELTLPPVAWLTAMFGLASVVLGLVWAVGVFALFAYVAKLSERIPEPKLVSFARFMRWAWAAGLGISVVVIALLALWLFSAGGMAAITAAVGGTAPATTTAPASLPASVVATTAPPGLARAGPPLMVFGCLFGIALVVFAILALVLFIQFGGHLRRQAEAARSTWASVVPHD
ncbi:MAG: hypothetical protein KKI02_09060 [Planctomycetes bacterium]|nr:hypothetical protein [Planctomycetota bacterium]